MLPNVLYSNIIVYHKMLPLLLYLLYIFIFVFILLLDLLIVLKHIGVNIQLKQKM